MTVVIGTAGHIDHGKSTLLRALTGIDADRLPEERRRGMTIDVGYAHLDLADGSALDFVDVPGHDKLVGTSGVVVSTVTRDGGRVKVAGEIWSAEPFDDDAVIEPGARVDIFEIRGATVVVHKIPELDS